ncbi:MAG: carboxypeptidase regulatory-like domain-containing protein [Planctomycetes bacterium]|nr:carboxypeptidase regulatory-like domain-containing protein [Planctomycetota bacterium]
MKNPFFPPLAFALIASTGCSGGSSSHKDLPKEPTVPVTGMLKYQGKPVPNASINFQSADGKVSARATSDAAGTFKVSTYGNGDGAPVGTYKVVVAVSGVQEVSPGVLAPEPPGGFKSPIPLKYGDPSTTNLSVEVKSSGSNDLQIDLK